jgi:ElaB/YqjD/DUF883 family membrane-anchored ribosome-binding protein
MSQTKLTGSSTAACRYAERDVLDEARRGADAVAADAKNAREKSQGETAALRDDLNHLKETVTKFVSAATSDAAESASRVASNVAGRVNSAAGDFAGKSAEVVSATADHAKTLVADFESMARRNPMGTLAAAVAVGIMIGMVGRRN